MSFERILVPVDFSEHSTHATEQAISLAEEMGSEIHLLHCYPIITSLGTPYGLAMPQPVYDSVRSSAEARLEQEREKIAARGLEVRAHLSAEPASFAISDVAKEIDADCIVMGTRGLSGLKHVLLGSVAERTLRVAPCPVLAVPARDDD